MRKIAFMFGAGAEMSYNLPSGGEFALNIFRQDCTDSKNTFRDMRNAIDSTKSYCKWLPKDYRTRSISAFGRRAYEDIIHGTVEQNRDYIIRQLRSIDTISEGIVEKFSKMSVSVSTAFENVNEQEIENSYMGAAVRFNEALAKEEENLFSSHYYSACLLAYMKMKRIRPSEAKELGKIITAILQLEIGALGEKLVNNINEGLFAEKVDDLDILDDLGDIIHLDYQSVGLSGFEYLLDIHNSDYSTDFGIILAFARELLQQIYASVLDYKTLIDSNWMYLYQPSKEWGKFCKISIFLMNTQVYMKSLLEKADISQPGYYSDIREALEEGRFELVAVGTSNYTDLAEHIIGCKTSHLNGSLSLWYDPYLNRIGERDELEKAEKHFTVPLLFTQSGTKPMISIDMSKQYVDYYDALISADDICVIGFGFNPDDEHINGMFRDLVDRQGKSLTVVSLDDGKGIQAKKKEIERNLKITNTNNISVITVDKNRSHNGINWLHVLLEQSNTDLS